MWILAMLLTLQDCCGESKLAPTAAGELVDYSIALKGVKDDCKEALNEAFQKRFGASAVLDGTAMKIKVSSKGRILLSDILAAVEEGKAELDESALSAKLMTVWFSKEAKSLCDDYPELNIGEAEDGTFSLSFGGKTTYTLADLRKLGKIEQGEIRVCSPKKGCCGK
jgi:hypothetical protein